MTRPYWTMKPGPEREAAKLEQQPLIRGPAKHYKQGQYWFGFRRIAFTDEASELYAKTFTLCRAMPPGPFTSEIVNGELVLVYPGRRYAIPKNPTPAMLTKICDLVAADKRGTAAESPTTANPEIKNNDN